MRFELAYDEGDFVRTSDIDALSIASGLALWLERHPEVRSLQVRYIRRSGKQLRKDI